jgi:hypothetical protein
MKELFAMAEEYIVACHLLEMPYGCSFTTMPKFPYEPNELVLLNVEGWLIPGRWRPGKNGPDCLELPGGLIELAEQLLYHIVGIIIRLDRQHCWN